MKIISDIYSTESLIYDLVENPSKSTHTLAFKIQDPQGNANPFTAIDKIMVVVYDIEQLKVLNYMIIPEFVATHILEYKLEKKSTILDCDAIAADFYSALVNATGIPFEDAPPILTHGLTPEEIDFIDRGEKLMAVKAVKDRTGLMLKEAKEIVDAYQNFHPNTF